MLVNGHMTRQAQRSHWGDHCAIWKRLTWDTNGGLMKALLMRELALTLSDPREDYVLPFPSMLGFAGLKFLIPR